MGALLGVLRLSIAFPLIALCAGVVLPLALLPLRVGGASPAAWVVVGVCRLAFVIFNFRFRCPASERLRRHHGFVFVNHITFFDILVMMQVAPMRFLSAVENRSWPLIGPVAAAIGTVFVDRSDKGSRAAAREALARAAKHPAIVIYPEGGVGPARRLRPFRYGAFEIAAQHSIAFLPGVIVYSRPEVIAWEEGESFMPVFWRAACFPGPMEARLELLETVAPAPADEAARLAAETHRAMARVLGVPAQM